MGTASTLLSRSRARRRIFRWHPGSAHRARRPWGRGWLWSWGCRHAILGVRS